MPCDEPYGSVFQGTNRALQVTAGRIDRLVRTWQAERDRSTEARSWAVCAHPRTEVGERSLRSTEPYPIWYVSMVCLSTMTCA